MTKFYLMMIIQNPWLDLDAASSNSEQEVMPNSVAESERSDHPEHNAQPSSYEAGAIDLPVEILHENHAFVEKCISQQPTADLESFDCIAEIFAGHAKSDRRFTLNAAKFELALIDPPPL